MKKTFAAAIVFAVILTATALLPPAAMLTQTAEAATPSTSSPLTVTTTSTAYFVPLGYIRLTCTSPTYYAVGASTVTATTSSALAPGPVTVNNVSVTRSLWINITSDQYLALLLRGGVQGYCIVEQMSADGVSGSFTTLAVSSTSTFTGAATHQAAVSAPSFDGGAGVFTTINTGGDVVVGGSLREVAGVAAFADAGFNQVTFNSTFTGTTTLNKACVALNNASPSIATATVNSGAVCTCSNATTQTNPVKCSVSSTTLTITGPNTTTDTVCYHCY